MSGMSYTLEQLRAVPSEELVHAHDQTATHTSVGVDYYLNELARRDAHAQGEHMVAQGQRVADMTRTIKNLTWVVAALTVANLVAVIAA